jgi:HK97 family phage major capsid protein/HK97 family phage prohead protease
MPLPKPKKGESQDDFVSRCMSEAYGSDAPDDRTQEQAVAMCMQAWRDRNKAMQKSHKTREVDLDNLPEPEKGDEYDGFMERCMGDTSDLESDELDSLEDACDALWAEAVDEGVVGEEESYKSKRRRKRRKGAAAMKTKQQFSVDDCPEPEEEETEDDYVSRCTDELAPDRENEDEIVDAEEACEAKWQEWENASHKPPQVRAKRQKQDEEPTSDDCPEPEGDEDRGDYMDRCVDSMLSDFPDADESSLREVCEEAYDDSLRSIKPPRTKQRAKGKKQDHQRSSLEGHPDTPDPEEYPTKDEFVSACVDSITQGDDSPIDEEGEVTYEDVEDYCEQIGEEYFAEKNHKSRRFKQRAGVTQFKTHSEEVQGMEFVLSDETPDRMGDVISSTGWELSNFLKNPIALFNHNSNFPIGRWHNLRVEKGGLRGRLEVAPKGTSQRIDEIRKLIDVGILRAVSVGFRPVEQQPRKSSKGDLLGLHFVKQELVETSLVSVPANPNALAVAKSLDISPATIDFVFAGSGDRGERVRRRSDGGSARTHRTKRRASAMTLAQRITDVQAAIVDRKDALAAHWAKIDDSNVSDADLQKTNDLNAEISRLEKQHAALVDSEKLLGRKTDGNGKKSLAVILPRPTITAGNGHDKSEAVPVYTTVGKKELDLLDLLVRGGTVAYVSKMWGKSPAETCEKIYGDHEATKLMTEIVMRAASAPAMTTVTGWAAELVQQTYTAMMETLMPKSILTRLAAAGLSLSFGRAGKINIPTRSRTPSIAGSFVGEGQAIPVRQGAFTSQALTPKKMAVITTWTREMDEHSIPAIEGILREAIQTDTTVAVDSVLIDANAATVIRPAGLLNGVAALTATAGGGIAAVVGDLKQLIGALTTATFGNIRTPRWLMNPAEKLTLSLTSAAATGVFPFAAQVEAGNLLGIPIIDSSTVPAKTVILIDAADFVVVGGEAPRFEMSDQATLHMEDTAPADLVGPGSPGTVAAPQRSLFQTDSLALRMIMPLNWTNRRAGTVAWTNNVTW